VGLVAGFLLAGAASVPGGDAVVTGQLALAAAGAAACGLAALRSRAVARGAAMARAREGRVNDPSLV
jgi:hypothetical protein